MTKANSSACMQDSTAQHSTAQHLFPGLCDLSDLSNDETQLNILACNGFVTSSPLQLCENAARYFCPWMVDQLDSDLEPKPNDLGSGNARVCVVEVFAVHESQRALFLIW